MSPLFKYLNILKLKDLVTLHVATFMFKFHNQLLPQVFTFLFTPTSKIHNHTRDLKLTDPNLFQEQGKITGNLTLGLRDLKFGFRLGNLSKPINFPVSKRKSRIN